MTGRKTLFVIMAGMLIILAMLFRSFSAESIWQLWSVPTLPPGFADLRAVVGAAEAARGGTNEAGNPFGWVAGYPKIWLALGWLGIKSSDTVWLAFVILGLYGLSLFLFARGYDSLTAVCLGLVVFSPAAMLGYERANLDLVIFVLLSAALWLTSVSPLWPVALITLAGMLKIFPIVGLGYLIRETRNKFLFWCGIGLGVFALYAISLGRAVNGAFGYIPKGDLVAYGAGVIGFYAYQFGASRTATDLTFLLSYLMLYLLLVAALYLSYRFPAHPDESGHPFTDAFRMGAIIYIATFVQGNSFNYRLIFLLFCIPQLVIWARSGAHLGLAGRATLIALIASGWGAILLHFVPLPLAFALDELANWILFFGLSYLFFMSLPDWLLDEVHHFFEKYDRRHKEIPS